MLDEKTIKSIALQFLKGYYKFRPRSGMTKGELDLFTDDGIISDGRISFARENGKIFSANFEATSAKVREEVVFQVQTYLLWWDSAAFGAICTACFLSLSYHYQWASLSTLGWIGFSLKLLLALGTFTLVYRFAAHGRKRYRYIYAVEQFKRYFADEQWIVIGEDVFDEPTDKAFEELKKQVVINGLGLLEVTKDFSVNLLITPARIDTHLKKRNQKTFKSKETIQPPPTPSGWSKDFWSRIKSKKPPIGTREFYRRFHSRVWHQIALLTISALLISIVIFKEWQRLPVYYVEENLQKQNPFKKPSDAIQGPEPDSFELLPQEIVPFQKKVLPYPLRTYLENDSPLVEDPQNQFIYECSRFFNLPATSYLIVETEFKNPENALERIQLLESYGFEANLFWAGCFKNRGENYLVCMDLLFPDMEDAQKEASWYDTLLKNRQLRKKPLRVERVVINK